MLLFNQLIETPQHLRLCLILYLIDNQVLSIDINAEQGLVMVSSIFVLMLFVDLLFQHASPQIHRFLM
ncbi:MAG: hypothetical protein EZS28_049992 [Streblomastix strix]|uniref:Uncharacterized protein n=1 Tax=Streblomastix strix TaxID=222440 RepID=A0A5J4T9X2_9EUKA|nr:MAG: hypothetical protein EZS28_049992 [Streblomastix strix]